MLNKKVLAVAIVGGLFAAGNAAAVDFTTATPSSTVGKFAKEIKTTSSASTATVFSGAGVSVAWKSGYAYSSGEVRYVRVEAAPHVLFQAFTPTAAGGVGAGTLTPGAVNGVGTNVITFSVTSVGGPKDGSAVITLPAAIKMLAIADSNISISLYDQPSQAQAGGETGKIAGGSVSGKYISFIDGLEWDSNVTVATSDVEADPSFTLFTGGADNATLNNSFEIVATGALSPSSVALNVGDLLDLGDDESSVTINGDFSFVASSGSSPYNAAARARVTALGDEPEALTATSATFDLNNGTAGNFWVEKSTGTWNPTIPAAVFKAKLNGVAANPTAYNVPVLPEIQVGEIVRNGTELQAPLVQIPGGWKSRLVLTNTSSVARPYTISLMNVGGETAVTPGTLTGTIPANGTKVIDDLATVFTGNNRATLNVSVAGPNNAIQGLYQIVNPDKGSISNHVLVRPGSN